MGLKLGSNNYSSVAVGALLHNTTRVDWFIFLAVIYILKLDRNCIVRNVAQIDT